MSRLRAALAVRPRATQLSLGRSAATACAAGLAAASLLAGSISAAGAATQLTYHEGNCSTASPAPNATGTLVAFSSTCDWTGENSDRNREIYQADAQGIVTQLTFTEGCTNTHPSSSFVGDVVAFDSDCDLGDNADRNVEIFLVTPGTVSQVTRSIGCTSLGASINSVGDHVAFDSDCDFAGDNLDASVEIFSATSSGTITQITSDVSGTGCLSMHASSNAAGDQIAFESDCDLVGSNPDEIDEIFQFSGDSVTQLTSSGDDPCINSAPSSSEDGAVIAFESDCDLSGDNPDFSTEIFTVTQNGTVTQVTKDPGSTICESFAPAISSGIDGNVLVFTGYCNPLGKNADGSFEVFRSTSGAVVQITDGEQCRSVSPALAAVARATVYVSTCDPNGLNPDGNAELFVADVCACGAAVSRDPDQPLASDALFALRTAVASAKCAICDCDVTGDHKITASDALLTLKKAVGQDVTLSCP
jgi:Tol biopolymer transport system component